MKPVDIEELDRLEKAAWGAPWAAHSFEIDCPCPDGSHCGDSHTCEEVTAPDEYPSPPGQCVVQISVPGLERFAKPTAEFIAATRNALPALIREVRELRSFVKTILDERTTCELSAPGDDTPLCVSRKEGLCFPCFVESEARRLGLLEEK